jgi:hypothetical protein
MRVFIIDVHLNTSTGIEHYPLFFFTSQHPPVHTKEICLQDQEASNDSQEASHADTDMAGGASELGRGDV